MGLFVKNRRLTRSSKKTGNHLPSADTMTFVCERIGETFNSYEYVAIEIAAFTLMLVLILNALKYIFPGCVLIEFKRIYRFIATIRIALSAKGHQISYVISTVIRSWHIMITPFVFAHTSLSRSVLVLLLFIALLSQMPNYSHICIL